MPTPLTNGLLCLVVGVPLVFNAVLIALLAAHMNARFDAVNRRFDDMR